MRTQYKARRFIEGVEELSEVMVSGGKQRLATEKRNQNESADPWLVQQAKKNKGKFVSAVKAGAFKGWELWDFGSLMNAEEFLSSVGGGDEDHPINSGWDGESSRVTIPPTAVLKQTGF